MSGFRGFALSLISLISFAAFPAYAQMAHMSPSYSSTPSSSTQTPTTTPTSATNNVTPTTINTGQSQASMAPAMARKPLLVIRFNQQHVYYEEALRQAVQGAEKAKPGVLYQIVSVIPSGATQAESTQISEQSSSNLTSVIAGMQDMSVPTSRINVTTQSVPAGNTPEIVIFVQ